MAEGEYNFTDGKPHVVDEKWLSLPWGGVGRARFRCYLCGHHFEVGDTFRWVFAPSGYQNALICEDCDGDDVMERWKAHYEDVHERGWWALPSGGGWSQQL